MADNHRHDSVDKDDDNGELLLDTDAENEAAFASNNTILAMSESLS